MIIMIWKLSLLMKAIIKFSRMMRLMRYFSNFRLREFFHPSLSLLKILNKLIPRIFSNSVNLNSPALIKWFIRGLRRRRVSAISFSFRSRESTVVKWETFKSSRQLRKVHSALSLNFSRETSQEMKHQVKIHHCWTRIPFKFNKRSLEELQGKDGRSTSVFDFKLIKKLRLKI